MTTAPYWFRMTDFSESPFPEARPKVWVEGEKGVFGSDGPLAPRRVSVTITDGGACLVDLVPSTDTSPPVRYVLRCDWLTTGADGEDISVGYGEWNFTALAGGGNIADMVTAAPSIYWIGPPWPDPLRPGIYIDRLTNDVGEVKP